MSQEYPERPQESAEAPLERIVSFSKLNAQAPEFVPRAQAQAHVSAYMYPSFQVSGTGWIYGGESGQLQMVSTSSSKEILTDELKQKIIKQVEYHLSDSSLATNDYLMKQMNKDPEGYVSISLIASFKKIKALVNNNHMLATALRSSSKLVVSEDGKKVRRQQRLTDTDIEEFQSRAVVVENLPSDHSHQNLEKIFGVVGSVKTVRVCNPPASSTSGSLSSKSPKTDMLVSNKLHALVEFETVEQAEKAVAELNNEKNWRSGLRVRHLLRRSPKSVRCRKLDCDNTDVNCEDDAALPSNESVEDGSQSSKQPAEQNGDDDVEEREGGSRRGRGRGRGRSRGAGQGRPPSQLGNVGSTQSESTNKQTPHSPRMPDGTRGFTMGRGKSVISSLSALD
ncbi:la-related protein 6C [Amborella trichopoda]|uniref:HTH La-type RNA-binding domain-containing protein n=1 Tax=Amborella trichopoda TaxID=13333 RepID=W1PPY0_AMBTC|nr:la-related protein 6C [Amborella trichopoda]ERN10118.1 hypothetical protein AMTR_s00169p00025570 [Amborella trichopoda]|eukprot:XP_020525576.1 la-related protein 6C [Amborella trichopoda]